MHLLLSMESLSIHLTHHHNAQEARAAWKNISKMVDSDIRHELRSAQEGGASPGDGELQELAGAIDRSRTLENFHNRNRVFPPGPELERYFRS
jgi:hypothetical protein